MFIGVNYSFSCLPAKLLARLAQYLAFKNVQSNNPYVSKSKKRVVDVTFDPERGNFPVTRGIETFAFNSLRTADVSPRSSPLKDVSRGGTSATQRQKFHTDDAKFARNPVRSANWWTDCCFSYRIYYVNWLIYVISMEFLSLSLKRTFLNGDQRGETSAVRRLFI